MAGMVGDANAIPYLRHGAKVGPVLFVIGAIIWITVRIRQPILHPFDSRKYRSQGDAFMAFIFNNFLLEFWAFCLGFAMLIVVGGGSLMKTSPGFKAAIIEIQENDAIMERIGKYGGTGALVSGSTSTYNADLDFSVYGAKGGVRVNISLSKELGYWEVKSLQFK